MVLVTLRPDGGGMSECCLIRDRTAKDEARGDEDRRGRSDVGESQDCGAIVNNLLVQPRPGKPIITVESSNLNTNEEIEHYNKPRNFEELLHNREGTSADETGKGLEESPPQLCKKEIVVDGKEEEKTHSKHESSEKLGQLQPYWGVLRAEELPPAVSACFEASPSLLARVQGRLLSLLGRGNRYSLPSSFPSPPAMPLEVLRRKVKEARHKLLHHSRPSSSKGSKKTHKDKSSASDSSSVSESSVAAVSTRGSAGGHNKNLEEPLQKYWGAEEGLGTSVAEEEIELLHQFLNLQHLARSRKHSAQLRRIRDSLLLQVRSRPNSIVAARDPALVPPTQTPKNDMQQLRDFLLDIGFVQDYSLLNRHGYDLATAAHMDALDLAGAGVTEPLHRMALKHELNLVQRPPQVPEEVPETVEQWLEGLGLPDYVENFHLNGIYCPLAALNLSKRDLQLMGVYMQGHRKKILLSIAGLKEIIFRPQ